MNAPVPTTTADKIPTIITTTTVTSIKPFKLVTPHELASVSNILALVIQLTMNTQSVSFNELYTTCFQLHLKNPAIAIALYGYLKTHIDFADSKIQGMIQDVFLKTINNTDPEQLNKTHAEFVSHLMPIVWDFYKTVPEIRADPDLKLMRTGMEIMCDYLVCRDDALNITGDNITAMGRLAYHFWLYKKEEAREYYRQAHEILDAKAKLHAETQPGTQAGTQAFSKAKENIDYVMMIIRRTMS